MSKKTNTEQFYEDWAVWFIAKKVLWIEKNSNNTTSNPDKTNNIQDNFPVEEKNEDIKEIEDKINERISNYNLNNEPIVPAIKISEITNEFKDIKVSTKNSEEQKNKQRTNLLNDIKKSLEKKEKNEETNEYQISDIFKTNIKLQQLLSNWIFEEFEDYIKVDDKYISYVWIWSTNLTVDWSLMLRVSQNSSIWNFSIHSIYQPVDVLYSKKMLEKKKKQLNIEIQTMIEKRWPSNVDLELVNALSEINWILEWLVSQEFKMYRYYNIIQLVDSDLDKLFDRRWELWILLQTMNYDMVKFRNLQQPVHNVFWLWWSYDSFLDLSIKDRLPNLFTTDESLSNVINFITKEDNNVKGIPIWLDIFNDKMICRDFWSWDNFNMCIFWSSWTWKSYTDKLISLREYNDWVRQIIIDPDAEFKALTENIWGDYINIWSKTEWEDDWHQLNPFDFNFPKVLMKKHWVDEVARNLNNYWSKIDYEFKEFLSRLKTLISIIIFNEKLPSRLYSEISTLLVNFFIEEWWLNPKDFTSYFKITKNPLSIKKFYKYLGKLIENNDPNKDKILIIKKWLFDYADDNWNFSWFLWEGENAVDIKSDWTVFNLKNVKNSWLKTVITFIIISFLEQIFAERQQQRTRVTIDEASTLLWTNIEIAWFIATLFQRARKYYMWITLIAQWLNNLYVDFKSAEKEVNYWDTIIQNCENLIILSQKSNGLNIIQDKLDLTPMQFKFLESLKEQKEHWVDVKWKALIITWTSVDQVQITPEPYIHKYINTDPRTKN
jgi:hypothetical protein